MPSTKNGLPGIFNDPALTLENGQGAALGLDIHDNVKTVSLNTSNTVINPATEDKQDALITAVSNISGLQRSTDLEGKGKVSVGITAVEISFTGTPESIIMSADSLNTGVLYVGKSNVTTAGANAICFLEAGESVTIDYDDTTNALYVVASIAGQNYWAGASL